MKKESFFPMDSFPSFGRRTMLRTVYPKVTQTGDDGLEEETEHRKRVMIDLDGTIHKYSQGYLDGSLYDGPFEGAKKVIDYLRNIGYEIVIFTTRASEENAQEFNYNLDEELTKIKDWLTKYNIYFDRITAEKLPADFYIDDKAINIPNGDWDTVLYVIKKRLEYKE
jgi:hypothetical protein